MTLFLNPKARIGTDLGFNVQSFAVYFSAFWNLENLPLIMFFGVGIDPVRILSLRIQKIDKPQYSHNYFVADLHVMIPLCIVWYFFMLRKVLQ